MSQSGCPGSIRLPGPSSEVSAAGCSSDDPADVELQALFHARA